MGFVPPLNLGGFQPSPATLAQWVYQIWQYLQENPIATQEQLQEYIGTFITTSPETQAMIGEGVEQYLTDNPPQAPVQSVQGKTGAVTLNYPDIVPASNAVPVYRAGSAPNVSTAQGLYNNGYRLFVNTATQEIFTISNSGALTLVGRGKFDGTTVDLNTAQGDTTIAEAINTLQNYNTDMATYGSSILSVNTSGWNANSTVFTRVGNILYFALQLTTSGSFPTTGHVDVMTTFTIPGYTVIGGMGAGVAADFTNTAFIEGAEAGWRVYSNNNRVRGLLLLKPAA